MTLAAPFVLASVQELGGLRAPGTARPPASGTDWQHVACLAERHRVAAYVQAAMLTTPYVPRAAYDAVARAALGGLVRAMRLDAALAEVATALHAAAIPAIVLKGPALARSLYPAAVFRPYDDIDLLVQEQHERAAAAILHDCGLTEVGHGETGYRDPHSGHVDEGRCFARMFTNNSAGVVIDLHVRALQLGIAPRCEVDRWRRARPLPQSSGLLMLSPEDQLIHLAVHAHKHGYARLIWLKDIDLLIRRYADRLAWPAVISSARQEGATASVWYSLYLSQRLLATPVPPPAMDALRPALPARAGLAILWPPVTVAALAGRTRRRAVQFTTFESWRGMLPSLLLMGRRPDRARAITATLLAPRRRAIRSR